MGVSSDYAEEESVEDVDRPANRPAYSCLDVSSVEEILGRKQPTLAEIEATWS